MRNPRVMLVVAAPDGLFKPVPSAAESAGLAVLLGPWRWGPARVDAGTDPADNPPRAMIV